MNREVAVVAGIIVKDKKVFSARRKTGLHLAGFWEFPGGKLEASETAEECLARELQEGFQIVVRVGDYVGETVYDYGVKVVRLIAYRVEHLYGDFELIDHDEVRWLAVDELDSVEWAPADIPLVQRYKELMVDNAKNGS